MKLEKVNTVLMLMVILLFSPSRGRGAYFYVSKSAFLLVHLSSEQCIPELSLVGHNGIGWHAVQTLVLTEYVCAARKYRMFLVKSHVFSEDTNILSQLYPTACVSIKLLRETLVFNFLRKIQTSISLQICPVHMKRSKLSVRSPVHCRICYRRNI